jgi:hypothetical protein
MAHAGKRPIWREIECILTVVSPSLCGTGLLGSAAVAAAYAAGRASDPPDTPPARQSIRRRGRSPGSRISVFDRLPSARTPVTSWSKTHRLQLRGQLRIGRERRTGFPLSFGSLRRPRRASTYMAGMWRQPSTRARPRRLWMTAKIASSPSVSAAGPGWRVSGDIAGLVACDACLAIGLIRLLRWGRNKPRSFSADFPRLRMPCSAIVRRTVPGAVRESRP